MLSVAIPPPLLVWVAAKRKVSVLGMPLQNRSDGVVDSDMLPDLPNYCARHVLQNPTMWLGVFVGG